jgi:hypothetical protein
MPTNAVITPVDASGNALATTGAAGGTATLVVSPASTVTTFLTYVSAAQAVSNPGQSFSTAAVAALAVDATLTSFTGGTSPTVTFFVDRFGADGVWYRAWTSTALSSAGPVSVNIGAGQSGTGAVPAVLTSLARFGWSSTGAPTAITFSASVIGR